MPPIPIGFSPADGFLTVEIQRNGSHGIDNSALAGDNKVT